MQCHQRYWFVSGVAENPERSVLRARIPAFNDPFPCLVYRESELRFVPIRDGRGEGLGGLDISTTDKDRARANAEAEGCLAGEDLVMICGMRLRLV